MRSRFLIGAGAWLLGAVTATTGSMIAVGALAHGLLSPQTQLLGAPSGGDLEATGSADPAASGASASSSPSQSAVPVQSSSGTGPGAGAAAPGVGPTLLTSADGSVLAACESGGAYLVYWSPDQGYTADDVARGPAPVASVTFSNQAGGVVMRVSCPSGTPVAHTFPVTPQPSDSPSDW